MSGKWNLTINGLCAVLIFLAAGCNHVLKQRVDTKPGLSSLNGNLIKDGAEYRGVGANYFDLFLRICKDPSDTSSLQGLEKLSGAGIPFVRFALAFGVNDWKTFFENRDEFFRRLDLVVNSAEKHDIGLIPSFFWSMTLPDLAGEHRDQWGNPDSKTISMMREFTGTIVARYRESAAMWGYEFGNEPNLHVDLPNAVQFRKKGGTERDDFKSAYMIVALTEFAREIRRHDKYRPIFSGNSHPRASAWHNTSESSWKSDTKEQTLDIINRDNPEPLDTISIHIYGDNPVEQECASWATNRVQYIKTIVSTAKEMKRPVFIGEFGLAESTNCVVVDVFSDMIADMDTAGVDLAAFWVYDLTAQDGSWNVTFDNNRSDMIKIAAEANKRWNNTALQKGTR